MDIKLHDFILDKHNCHTMFLHSKFLILQQTKPVKIPNIN